MDNECKHNITWETIIDGVSHMSCKICGEKWTEPKNCTVDSEEAVDEEYEEVKCPYVPKYYIGSDGLVASDVIYSFDLNYNLGNVIKYIVRAGKKNERTYIRDLEKAKNCIDMELQRHIARREDKW